MAEASKGSPLAKGGVFSPAWHGVEHMVPCTTEWHPFTTLRHTPYPAVAFPFGAGLYSCTGILIPHPIQMPQQSCWWHGLLQGMVVPCSWHWPGALNGPGLPVPGPPMFGCSRGAHRSSPFLWHLVELAAGPHGGMVGKPKHPALCQWPLLLLLPPSLCLAHGTACLSATGLTGVSTTLA